MKKAVIPVTKPYLPSREKLNRYIDGIYERNWLTNNGPLVQELTQRLEDFLGVKNLLLVANGTLALQIAYRTLDIHEPVNNQPAEAITTPFTFIATASSLKWKDIQPIFVDIDPDTWNLDPKLIEASITPQTRALVPVHVFGNPCDVEAIHVIAEKHQLKVIYDAAHAFGVKYKGQSILHWGDAATVSFHATKVFHTIEGGAIIFKRKEDLEKAKKLINFGITGPEKIEALGINAKLNEFQAAMGLCILDELHENIKSREDVFCTYQQILKEKVTLQKSPKYATNNYGYFPILMDSKSVRDRLDKKLKKQGINGRKYFYPSIESLEFLNSTQNCPVSMHTADRVYCLPIYSDLSSNEATIIAETVYKQIKENFRDSQ